MDAKRLSNLAGLPATIAYVTGTSFITRDCAPTMAPFPNSYALQDGRARSYPDIVLDDNGCIRDIIENLAVSGVEYIEEMLVTVGGG